MSDPARPFQARADSHDEAIPPLEYRDFDQSHDELPEPTVCATCGAVYIGGRWQWRTRPEYAYKTICMACHRTVDLLPAGYVYIDGPFADDHLVDVLELLRRHEASAMEHNPMQRIMSVDEGGGTTVVATTGQHLAHVLGTALEAAYQGRLEVKYSHDKKLVRVYWRR
ncbi:BCAM0308 family protein [Trinickia fusca]|uniref:ATPase n=1 Tax=Trinickia fusca TaxID=2419777 RepID=A0A494X094_9BURK|nr:BCAM0308 family protein [Trinickia fusca]RKP44188.1 ATPase [Trinickia fusca]